MLERGRAAALTAALALFVCALAGCGGGSDAGRMTYVICVDSTYSTDDVRPEYMQTLLAIAERGVDEGVHIYADACGSNATGTVKWPVDKDLELHQDYDGIMKSEVIASKAKKMEPEFEENVIDRTSPEPGTPLGEMLAVIARQCKVDPGPCEAYVLTDAAWDDPWLSIRDGIDKQEKKSYLARYVPLLAGLKDVPVYFGGVGHGTKLGEQRLAEAEDIAKTLIKDAGGTLVVWDVNLGTLARPAAG